MHRMQPLPPRRACEPKKHSLPKRHPPRREQPPELSRRREMHQRRRRGAARRRSRLSRLRQRRHRHGRRRRPPPIPTPLPCSPRSETASRGSSPRVSATSASRACHSTRHMRASRARAAPRSAWRRACERAKIASASLRLSSTERTKSTGRWWRQRVRRNARWMLQIPSWFRRAPSSSMLRRAAWKS